MVPGAKYRGHVSVPEDIPRPKVGAINCCLAGYEAGETKPFRGDEHPLERLFTNFLSEATESYKERLGVRISAEVAKATSIACQLQPQQDVRIFGMDDRLDAHW